MTETRKRKLETGKVESALIFGWLTFHNFRGKWVSGNRVRGGGGGGGGAWGRVNSGRWKGGGDEWGVGSPRNEVAQSLALARGGNWSDVYECHPSSTQGHLHTNTHTWTAWHKRTNTHTLTNSRTHAGTRGPTDASLHRFFLCLTPSSLFQRREEYSIHVDFVSHQAPVGKK